jgi:multicomponent Na+:H+ antiporter subunit B
MRGMTPIVKTITDLLIGFILLFGFYTVLSGHISPGGGFAGGIICAAGLILMTMAAGAEALRERLSRNLRLAALGLVACTLLVFFVLPLVGLPLSGTASVTFLDVVIGLSVGAGLFGAFLMLAAFPERRKTRGEGEGD